MPFDATPADTKQNVQHLIDLLESEVRGFDMRCADLCIAGHADVLWPECEGRWGFYRECSSPNIAERLGMRWMQADCAFTGRGRTHDDITRAHAVSMLRHYRDTREVDWPRAMGDGA